MYGDKASRESRMTSMVLDWANGKPVTPSTEMRALEEEQIGEKRSGVISPGPAEVEGTSAELPGGQVRNWFCSSMSFPHLAGYDGPAARPAHHSPQRWIGGSGAQLQLLRKRSPRGTEVPGRQPKL